MRGVGGAGRRRRGRGVGVVGGGGFEVGGGFFEVVVGVVGFWRGGRRVVGGWGVVGGFGGVLKGDLKGWERVWLTESRRRRLEGRSGDMAGRSMLVGLESFGRGGY